MTNLQLHIQKAKRIGVNLTVLATSISLAACGGGGSEGFYANNNSNNPNTGAGGNTVTAEATGVTLSMSKEQLNANGDEFTVTAKAVDKDGGGIAGKKINLNIANAITNGATSDASEKTTDEAGNVTFTVRLDGSNKAATELLLTTTISGTTINNVRKLTISGPGTVVQSQYEVKFEPIKSLKVTGGQTEVKIRAVDTNGGGVPNQAVKLAIKDFTVQSDLSIKGVSSAVTDNDGYATFTLQLTQGSEANRLSLMQSGIQLLATLSETNGATKTQVTTVGVASVVSLVSSLTLSTGNNNKVEAIDGNINVIVNARNPEGAAVANQTVTLALDEMALQYGAKLSSSTAKTDANGNAIFIITTETNSLNTSGQLLVQNGITASASLQAIDGSTVSSQTTKITVVSTVTDEVSYLRTLTADQIEIKGGQAVVTVTAVDKNGGTLPNKRISLAVRNSAANGIIIKDGSQQTTDTAGNATFTLQFNPTGVSETAIASLLASGIDVGAAYAKSSGGVVTQTTRIQFYAKSVQNSAVDRLEMSVSKGVVNASNDSVEVKIRAIDEKGNAAANQAVKFELTSDATQNGVKFDGASTKVSDANGYVSYTLSTTAPNSDAIDKLIASGITAKASSGAASQTIQVMVQAAASETVAVSYLSMSTDGLININKGQAKVAVKAVDSNGGILVNRAITLKIADSQKNGLTLVGSSKVQTDSEGKATFVIAYDGSITDQNLLTQLKNEGVLLTAEYQPANGVSSITQTTRVRYYEQSVNADVQQLAFTLSKGVAVASNDVVTITVKAADENGQAVTGRKISLSLPDVAKKNGVSLLSGSSIVSDASGEAKFNLKLAAPNTEAINALTAAGIELTASTEQNTGEKLEQTAKLMVAATAQAQLDVAYLTVDNLQSINAAQSAERVIKVKAINSSGAAIANKDITLGLSQTYNGISIKEGGRLTTNASGEVSFTLVYNAALASDADKIALQTQGLTFTATYRGNQGTVSQTSTLAYFTLPANIFRMDLVVDKGALVVDSTTAQTVNVLATLKDIQGNPVGNRLVTLALDDTAVQNGVSFTGVTGGSTVVSTDAAGQVKVSITVQPDTSTSINALVASGIGIGASAIQGDGSEPIRQSIKVNILSSAALSEVGYLTSVMGDNIATTGGSTSITVKAFNSNGTALAGKAVALKLATIPQGLTIRLDAASKVTGADGSATFNVTYIAPAGLSAEQIKALLAGIAATATYTNNAGINTTQTTTVQFYADQVNIYRIDLVVDKSSLVVNSTSNDTFQANIILKDNAGNAVKNRQVILALDSIALQSGVNIVGATGGLIAVQTDNNGQAKVDIIVQPTTKEAVAALVNSGIGIGVSAIQGDGSGPILQNTKITILSAAALNEVGYLTATSSNSIATAGGSTTITVNAFNKDGTALTAKAIDLKLTNIPTGVSLTVNPVNALTDATGATFKVSYTPVSGGVVTDDQIKALLTGVNATAIYTNSAGINITQSTIVQFNKNDVSAATDVQRLELVTSKGLVQADTDTLTLSVKATSSSGTVLAGKIISLGLNLAATANGVTVASNTATTNAQGVATFTLNISNTDEQQIKNLVANGIDLAAATVLSEGTMLFQNTKVMVQSPESANPAVASLQITPLKQTVSTLGDSTDIVVRAIDKDGNALKDKEVTFALAPQLSSRVSVDQTSKLTNSNGYVTFRLTVAAGTDPAELDLVQSGITFAVNTVNTDAPIPVTQVGKINVTVPQESTNLTISSSKPTLLASGDSAEIYTRLVDQNLQPVKNSPVALTVVDSALNGVTIEGANNAITDASGNAKFNIKLTRITDAQYQALLTNGVTVRASITLSNGVVRSQDVHLNVNEAVSQYHLRIDPDKNSLSVDGDKTLVVVSLLDSTNQPVTNKNVTLTARNTAAGIVINGTGSGITSLAQTVTTDELGRAFFTVTLPSSGFDKELLIASGILLEASHTEENGAATTQVSRLSVFRPSTSLSQTQPARYSLRISSAKPTLNVRNDSSDVTVTVVDANGGGVSGQYVTLSLADFARNGASILGASGLTTDANGQAVFKVKVDETARTQTYPAASFAADDLNLTARFSETGYFDAIQLGRIDVVQAVVAQPVASVVIGVNPTEVGATSDGIYYTRNLSASVVDFDGKPLANQEVALDITPLSYAKGAYSWDLVTDALGNQSEKWVYHATVSCAANAAGTAVTNTQVTNIPVKVPTFLGGQGAIATYTTDTEGKFDFTIRYPKIYAQWLNVQIGASSTVASLPNRTTYNLGLPPLATDYSTDGTSGPNLTSPYGTTNSCP